ncbi:MAG: redoxin domain-containing protein, partial [Solirubrobacteraceae bacterium]
PQEPRDPEPPDAEPSDPDAPDPDPPDRPALSRLDPDRVAVRQAPEAPRALPPAGEVIDTRRYRWMIGIIGLVLVIVFSVYQLATHGVGTTGVPAGNRLHFFSAPLANTDLNGDPNLNPPCTLAGHDPRALNICLMARRGPLVLSFFVTGASQCIQQVNALQTLSREFPASAVQFAAVAVRASHKSVAALIRSKGWTIPVAYDRDGSVGELYGVAVCPMAELSYRGGVVKERLIGNHWQTSAALAPQVRALVAAQRTRPG